jgi:DNA-binding protein H-NS
MAGLCMLGVCGCQNSRDIEDNHFIMTLGIEKGEKKLFKFIYEMADISDQAKDGGEKNMPVLFYEADTFEEAEKQNGLQSNKMLDYGHLKVIILSEEVVGENELRQKLIEQLERKNSIAGTTLLMFTREKIEEIIKKCSESGVSCGEYLEMMEANRKKKEQQKKTLAAVLRDYSEGKRRIGVTILRKNEEIKIWDGIMHIKEETEFQIYYDSVLRFHIRANSDSEKDQVVKNLIKDEVLVKIQNILKGCENND